jgi:23S rRNA (adenine2503-C2)-methyltransferase
LPIDGECILFADRDRWSRKENMESLSLTKEDWEKQMVAWGQPAYRASQILEWIYQRRVRDWNEMSNSPAALRVQLETDFPPRALVKVRETGSRDTTRKFLFRLADGQLIESVLIPASPALDG